jgi:hypothetical protein
MEGLLYLASHAPWGAAIRPVNCILSQDSTGRERHDRSTLVLPPPKTMPAISSPDIAPTIDFFRTQQIPVFTAKDEDPKPYERCVATANRLYRFARPDCVVLPENASQVQTIVKEAKSKGIRITIKCAGHSYAGHSTADRGIALDLRNMHKDVSLDEQAMMISMDAGCQWGQVYKELINDRKDGWIVNGGRCPNVGVSGFILGSGLGPFTRSFGMGSDTLQEIQIVTAKGELVTVKRSDREDSDKGKLFWALCGAGGGNFGVVVRLKMKVMELSSANGYVVSGRSIWYPKPVSTNDGTKSNLDGNPDFMATMNNFYTRDWPTRTTIDSTWVCETDKPQDLVRFLVYHDGSKRDFEAIIDQHVKQETLRSMLKRRAMPEPSTRFLHETLVDQWAEETERAKPNDERYHIYSSFVFGNDLSTIKKVTKIILDSIVAFREDFLNEGVLFSVTWIHSGGKAGEKKPQDSAFYWRKAIYHVYATIEWKDKWLEKNMWTFMGNFKSQMRPLSLNKAAAFINFPDNSLKVNAHEQAYFGDNYKKLRDVKKLWDPDGFFQFSQGINLPGSDTNSGEGPDHLDPDDLTDSLAGDQWGTFETELTNELDELRELGYN